MSAPSYKVFLSHASYDVGVANLIARVITRPGLECWVDAKDLGVGAHFRSAIAETLCGANELLVLASPRFAKSKWLDFEVGMAMGAGLEIIPLLYDCTLGRISDFDVLRHLHAVHIDDFDKYETQLIARANAFFQANEQPLQGAAGGSPHRLPPPVVPPRGFYGRPAGASSRRSDQANEGVRKLQERIRRELKPKAERPKGDEHDD
ncbi:MAG: toll/interleukin-1 receptor domain-containing protein [Hyphomicrobiaceae bacterium]